MSPEPRTRRKRTTLGGRTIVHLTAEFSPYARTGGLAEAVAGLASFQASAGHTVVVFMPLYSSVREIAPGLEPLGPVQMIQIGPRAEEVRFFGEMPPRPGPRVIFVDSPAYFRRAGLYGNDGADYADNHLRFALFCMAALAGIKLYVDGPVLLHVHDWHAALAAVYLRSYSTLREAFGPTPVIVSVHNAGYQGHFPETAMEELGLPWELWRLDRLEWYGQLNLLKGALTHCDMAITVSPTHAAELCTPQGGFGLHDVFQHLGTRLVGICNGIDQHLWNPAEDDQIAARYSRDDLSGKLACKSALQRAFGLRERPEAPLLGMTGRLVTQKGFDIILGSNCIHSLDAQFIFLGRGEPWVHAALATLAFERPEHVAVEFAFTDLLEHRLMAGSDTLLMPSLYEPCGLAQMRAQLYGTPVIGRNIGGIHDTVIDGSTGFLFDEFRIDALDHAIARSLDAFARPRTWKPMMRRAMKQDFSWGRAAAAYEEVYRSAGALVAERGD
ncbi:MAG: glycogen synthase [Gemmatimonadaceae bacterium]